MNILTKVKFFLWRAATNLLPTVENLWKEKLCRSLFVIFVRRIWKLSPMLLWTANLLGNIETHPWQDMLSMLQCLIKKANYQGDWTGNFCVVDGVECQKKNMFLKENSDPAISIAKPSAVIETSLSKSQKAWIAAIGANRIWKLATLGTSTSRLVQDQCGCYYLKKSANGRLCCCY